ncbi:MAG TPA: hypothetical protein VGW14_10770, partial [Thermoleophilaceae bacterium]|nr:hypothetical protein [Thermoleophilaceae bacterium]
MRRLARLLGWLVLAGIAAPGAATAAPRALLDAPRAGDLALAGGEVLVSSAVSGGEARLTAVPVDGGPAREPLRARPPGRGAWISSTRLASSDRLTAMLVEFTDPEGNPRDWRVYAGPPSGPLSIAHRVRLERAVALWIPIEIDVHGDRLLVQELRLPFGERGERPRFRLTVYAPGVTSAPVPQPGYGSPAVVAGDRVAHVARRRPPLIRIVDWRTGRLSGTIGLGRASGEIMERHLDLAED